MKTSRLLFWLVTILPLGIYFYQRFSNNKASLSLAPSRSSFPSLGYEPSDIWRSSLEAPEKIIEGFGLFLRVDWISPFKNMVLTEYPGQILKGDLPTSEMLAQLSAYIPESGPNYENLRKYGNAFSQAKLSKSIQPLYDFFVKDIFYFSDQEFSDRADAYLIWGLKNRKDLIHFYFEKEGLKIGDQFIDYDHPPIFSSFVGPQEVNFSPITLQDILDNWRNNSFEGQVSQVFSSLCRLSRPLLGCIQIQIHYSRDNPEQESIFESIAKEYSQCFEECEQTRADRIEG